MPRDPRPDPHRAMAPGAELQAALRPSPSVTIYSAIVSLTPTGHAEVAFDIPIRRPRAVMAWNASRTIRPRRADDVGRYADRWSSPRRNAALHLVGDRSTMPARARQCEGPSRSDSRGSRSKRTAGAASARLAPQTVQQRAQQRNRLAVPLTASGDGIAKIQVKIAGPANSRSTAIRVPPSRRRGADRRTVRTIEARRA